jgi:hypothetical protein
MLTKIGRTGSALVCLLMFLMNPAAGDAAETSDGSTPVDSEQGLFKVSYRSSLEPIVINEMHEWVLHVSTPDGQAVDDASISIAGGMPAHNHGLPTNPQVTENLGNGSYRVEGLRFHMRGDWEIVIDISAGEQADRVRIAIRL